MLEFKLAKECETRAIHPVRGLLSVRQSKQGAVWVLGQCLNHVCFVTVRVYVLLSHHLPMKRDFSAGYIKAVHKYKTGRRLYPDHLATDHFDSNLWRSQASTTPVHSCTCEIKWGYLYCWCYVGGLENVTACHETWAFSGYQAVGHEVHFLPQYICSLLPCVLDWNTTVCWRRVDRHGVPRRFGFFRPRRGLPRSSRSDTVESQPSCLVCVNWPLMGYFRHVSPSHWPDDFSPIILLTSRLSSRCLCL